MKYDSDHFDSLYESGDGDPWEFYESTYEQRKYDRTLNAAVDRTADTEVDAVLELGCGNGAFTARLVDAFPEADVHGVDISEEALAVARDRVDGATFEHAEMVEWAADRTESFDLVFASECLYYPAADLPVTEYVGFTRTLTEFVAPEGYLVSASIHRDGEGSVTKEDERVVRTIRATLERHADLVGREQYTDTKREDGDIREYDYEIWTFAHES